MGGCGLDFGWGLAARGVYSGVGLAWGEQRGDGFLTFLEKVVARTVDEEGGRGGEAPGRRTRPKAEAKGRVRGGFSPPAGRVDGPKGGCLTGNLHWGSPTHFKNL